MLRAAVPLIVTKFFVSELFLWNPLKSDLICSLPGRCIADLERLCLSLEPDLRLIGFMVSNTVSEALPKLLNPFIL